MAEREEPMSGDVHAGVMFAVIFNNKLVFTNYYYRGADRKLFNGELACTLKLKKAVRSSLELNERH
jgi:hypothetical protein